MHRLKAELQRMLLNLRMKPSALPVAHGFSPLEIIRQVQASISEAFLSHSQPV
jgi:hypothetical protein